MKILAPLALILTVGISSVGLLAFADTAPSALSSPAAPPSPLASPVIAPSPTPEPTVPVAEPAAPPNWAQDLMVAAQSLPVVGPLITKALLYLGIVSSILTLLVAFILSMLSAIAGISNFAGLSLFAAKINEFKNGKIMYWIKFFSLFNGKKPAAE